MNGTEDKEDVVQVTHHHHYERQPVSLSRFRLAVGVVAAAGAGGAAFFSPSWASALSVAMAIIAIVITL